MKYTFEWYSTAKDEISFSNDNTATYNPAYTELVSSNTNLDLKYQPVIDLLIKFNFTLENFKITNRPSNYSVI